MKIPMWDSLFFDSLGDLLLSLFANVNAGVTHVGGDMFKSIPSGDAIFMKV